MPLAATVLAAAWFATAFALRIGIQVRRYADTGVRHDAGPRWSAGWWARLLFVTATVAVVAGPVLALTGSVGLLDALDHPAVAAAGAVLAVGGMAATFAAQLAMGRSWRIGVDESEHTELVTDGPFAVVRNPIFSTMAVTALGLTLLAPTGVGVAGLAGLLAALEVQVRLVEEPHLRRVHGVEYDRYRAQVGRFLPWIGRGA
jgi:protein-S-isoprenylcysteine O-methyltransferase Ste14